MGPLTMFAIFIMIWWVTLFVTLPFGNVSHHEAGVETKDGGDPGAPLVTNLKKKMLINTGIAFVVWAISMIVIHFGLIPAPEFPHYRP
ncbi:DUF1467 family protein [Asticcacaulis sp. YBE204]|uniref:DUF1467 family protein n=1 Tax=Asticcacaulis sp. YBE204 TaxID=1282363 RepID=UPI0003C3E32D|nr:DUF1467 family protein [Asticcacaulis sp. YBE204]ESQ78157.1 hypothetical protein AEYBE204_15050 [Asticcacaulis sp. YBE204]